MVHLCLGTKVTSRDVLSAWEESTRQDYMCRGCGLYSRRSRDGAEREQLHTDWTLLHSNPSIVS